MNSHEAMRRAIKLAEEKMRSGEGRPFGCVILLDGEIIGEGWNSMDRDHDPTAHGEVVAIRDACRRLKTLNLSGAELYTSCEPCPMCTSVIIMAGIAKLYYAASADDTAIFGNDPSRLRREVGKPVAERSMASEQLLGEEGRALLMGWAAMPNG
ncbi:MAG: nucleoside deaminase [Rhodospirillaceae bacterium]|jgi:guanine deaminase|nr:nucleoside deaminase [Rhodospirillaceae bacterium]MBT3927893.1 nucleoside deaminase [Rhodospirillaceae bacterium]MBT4427000.1 nucleoside deaminase [Rhodospirillaceae bacterium]MBT5037462.1 nucleoside deaminase [Rhodospirillaceae bacterium]MBT5674667.1 nucleoside deaminase [Rhodospirillaceae bacterium]